jgi:hypothetical protein
LAISFNDEHINGILSQALKNDRSKIIVSIQPIVNEDVKTGNSLTNEKNRIRSKLNLDNSENIFVEDKGAKEFLENDISLDFYKKFYDDQNEPF